MAQDGLVVKEKKKNLDAARRLTTSMTPMAICV